jgi:hypothetical protein
VEANRWGWSFLTEIKNQRPFEELREEIMMASFLMTSLLTTAGGRATGLPAKETPARSEKLNEFVVILFLTLGPALGAVIFLTWLGGLVWGLLASLL